MPSPPSGIDSRVPEGFIVVDKPPGITSHDVVAAVRRAVGMRRVGHAGTLDPMATGVVVTAVGRVTRLIRFVQDAEKEYEATGLFGVATDSLDADGAVLEREPMAIEPEDVDEVLPRFRGVIDQVPPMVSALKVKGERLYEIARRGETVERDPRVVEVHSLEMTDFVPGPYPEVSFRVVCGKGTYVRSLVDDIARALGGRAHLSRLRRTRVGSLALDRAVSLDDLEGMGDRMLGASEALAHLPSVAVDADTAQAVSNGVRFATGPLAHLDPHTPTVVVDGAGEVLAVYAQGDGGAKPEVVLG